MYVTELVMGRVRCLLVVDVAGVFDDLVTLPIVVSVLSSKTYSYLYLAGITKDFV